MIDTSSGSPDDGCKLSSPTSKNTMIRLQCETGSRRNLASQRSLLQAQHCSETTSSSITRRWSSSCALGLLFILFISSPSVSAFTNPSYRSTTCRNFYCRSRRPQVPLSSFLSTDNKELQVPMVTLTEVDVQYKTETVLQYDPKLDRFVNRKQEKNSKKSSMDQLSSNTIALVRPFLSSAFLPEGVNDSYYQYMRWRFAQRFINANLHVIGTQSLLLGLGIKSKSTLGLSAALNWVLKDALGKIARMIWASKMGRQFDSDAKRWRFRASILFALGNYLEIVTYINPQLFLLWATLANCCKQVAMLTSSATRTSLYNSFRDGTRENIGDITAKGEAQISVVDLFGIVSGVCLSRAVGTSVKSVLMAYVGLQVVEIFCMYHEIRAVQFRVLNFDRMVRVLRDFVSGTSSSGINGEVRTIPTPQEMAEKERIFLPPKRLSRRSLAFGSLGRAKLTPAELTELMLIFQKERFMLIVGANTKHPAGGRRRQRRQSASEKIQEHCHIVLHADATNTDIVKSTLALTILRQKLVTCNTPLTARSSDCWELIRESRQEADRRFPKLLKEMSIKSWASPARFMFGTVHMRATWPLMVPSSSLAK